MIKKIKNITSNLTALYVEDDPIAREQMVKFLTKFFKKVDQGENGQDGLNKYISSQDGYDVVFSDISMPIMNGLDMLNKIKELKNDQYTVVISAHDDSKTLIRAIEIGAEFFIIKPASSEKIIETLNKLAEKIEKHEFYTKTHFLYKDTLTGLPTKAKLFLDLKEKTEGALIICEIDSFHEIFDFYGSAASDVLLVEVAKRLEEYSTSINGNAYRLDGQQFGIVLAGTVDNERLNNVMKELWAVFSECQVIYEDLYIIPEITMGSSTITNISTADDMVSNALLALGKAKVSHQVHLVYEEKMRKKNQDYRYNMVWTQKIKRALKQNNIVVFFQPIMDNQTKEVAMHESLVRLLDDGKIVYPKKFLYISKKAKIYPEITKAVITKTLEAFRGKKHRVSINLSITDIVDKNTRDFIINSMSEYGTGAAQITFELMESEQIHNYYEIQKFIDQIKSYGCKFAIDDFGSGFSSFTHILNLGFDYIKIDGSIISRLQYDAKSRLIVEAIVAISKKMGVKTVAEFVSSEEIFNLQKKLGVDYSQGYYIGKPKYPELL